MSTNAAVETSGPIPSAPMAKSVAGTLLFVCSESFVFGALFVAYFFVRIVQASHDGSWEQVFGRHLPVGEALVNTAILLASSGTAWLAERLRTRRRGAALGVLGATMLLGACFLGIQVKEFLDLAHVAHVGPGTSAYASVFYTLTSIHGLHVFVGLLVLAAMWLRTLRGARTEADQSAYHAATLYWHFVDAMWVVIVGLVYLPDNVARIF